MFVCKVSPGFNVLRSVWQLLWEHTVIACVSEIKLADDYVAGKTPRKLPRIIQLADSRDHKVRQLGLFCGRCDQVGR